MPRFLLIPLLLVSLLAGCGGDDSSSDGGGGGGGEAMSKEDFVAEANKICREGEQKLNEVTKDSASKIADAKTSEEQQKAVADVLEDTAKEYDPYLDRLRDLNPPSELSNDWNQFVGGISDAFDLIPDLADATREGDRDKLQELSDKFTKIAGDTRPFAEQNGLNDCLPDQNTA